MLKYIHTKQDITYQTCLKGFQFQNLFCPAELHVVSSKKGAGTKTTRYKRFVYTLGCIIILRTLLCFYVRNDTVSNGNSPCNRITEKYSRDFYGKLIRRNSYKMTKKKKKCIELRRQFHRSERCRYTTYTIVHERRTQ